MSTKRPPNGHGKLLIPDALGIRAGNGYEPLSSVWEQSDGELLEAMFDFYATIPPEPIGRSTLYRFAIVCPLVNANFPL